MGVRDHAVARLTKTPITESSHPRPHEVSPELSARIRLTSHSFEIRMRSDIDPDLCCGGSSDRLQSLHPTDFADLFCVGGPRCVLDFVLKLTPPGLSRWNQVFALLDDHEEEEEVVQKPEDHPGKRGGV